MFQDFGVKGSCGKIERFTRMEELSNPLELYFHFLSSLKTLTRFFPIIFFNPPENRKLLVGC